MNENTRNHLLNLDSVVLLKSRLGFGVTLESELAASHVHVVKESQRAQGAVCIFVFRKRKILQRHNESLHSV